jgi:hypothetical protein
LEDVERFVEWRRVPAAARSDAVALLPWFDGPGSIATVNRRLSAVASFYEFHPRHGVEFADLLTRWRPGRRGGSWQPFLAHLGQRPERHRSISLRAEPRAATALPVAEMDALVATCARLRDRFLLFVLRGCGLRIGDTWGCGMRTSTRAVSSSPSDLARTLTGARAKTCSREAPANTALIHLYGDNLHEEYGQLTGSAASSAIRRSAKPRAVCCRGCGDVAVGRPDPQA